MQSIQRVSAKPSSSHAPAFMGYHTEHNYFSNLGCSSVVDAVVTIICNAGAVAVPVVARMQNF